MIRPDQAQQAPYQPCNTRIYSVDPEDLGLLQQAVRVLPVKSSALGPEASSSATYHSHLQRRALPSAPCFLRHRMLLLR
jgi:hypothetical protein